jgi:hypothetical protein
MPDRPTRITFGEMRVYGVLVYCADHHCSHGVALSAQRWRDDFRLSSGALSAVPAAGATPTSGRISTTRETAWHLPQQA